MANDVNIQDIIDATSAKERFNKLDSDRNSVLTRARSCSALTIPSVLPADGHTETAELATPYQSLGARLVNNLSSKLLLSLLPPNTSFFRLIVSDDVKETLAQSPGQNNPDVGGALSEVEGKLVQIEQQILKQIEREALRVPTFEAIKSLIITGNALCYKTEANLDTYKLNDYVIVRDFSGTPIEIITRATAVKDSLPQTIIDALGEDIPEDGKVNIYTRAVYKNGVWYEYQTVEELLVEGSEVEYSDPNKFPYIPLRWTAISGENYGRGLVEQYLGDFRSLEGLYQLLIESSAVQARTIFGKKPGSLIDIDELNSADNGAVVYGDLENDISTLRVDKGSDLQVPMNMIQDLTRRLEQAFLVASSVARQSERTTATEIRYMASDLEEALGGVYSVLSLEYQRPLAYLLLAQSKVNLKSLGLDAVIVTGVEALGRNNELDKLRQFNSFLQELGNPEMVLARLNIDNYISTIGASLGLDVTNLIKSQGQIDQEQQAQAGQQLAMQGATNVVNGATTAPKQ